jgi:hypothetical protein
MALGLRMQSGARLFDSVQATWNLMEQSAGDALLEAHEAGLQVIVKVRGSEVKCFAYVLCKWGRS